MGSTRAPAAWVLQTGIGTPKTTQLCFQRGREGTPASLALTQQVPRGGDQNCDKMAVIFWLTNYRFGNLIAGIELVY
jgi:hypothetical protein